jgi:hypothetical protein
MPLPRQRVGRLKIRNPVEFVDKFDDTFDRLCTEATAMGGMEKGDVRGRGRG